MSEYLTGYLGTWAGAIAPLALSEPCYGVSAKTFGLNFTHPSLTPSITTSAMLQDLRCFLAKSDKKLLFRL